MSDTRRRVTQPPLPQGVEEKLPYIVDTTRWDSGPPTSPVVTLWDITGDARTEVAAKLQGSPAVDGMEITTPLVKDLEVDHLYRLEIKWNVDSKVYETWAELVGEY
jgi:hypothetical protein